MSKSTYLKWALVITLAGTLFAGYLSGTKLFGGYCVLKEPCPFFLGQPVCYYGFAFFFSMFVVTLIALFKSGEKTWAVNTNAVISILGILFSGYFATLDVMGWIADKAIGSYTLGLPSCMYGLFCYIIVFILSAVTLKKKCEHDSSCCSGH